MTIGFRQLGSASELQHFYPGPDPPFAIYEEDPENMTIIRLHLPPGPLAMAQTVARLKGPNAVEIQILRCFFDRGGPSA